MGRRKTVIVEEDPEKQTTIRWTRTRSAEGFYTNPAEWKSRFKGYDLRLERMTHEKYLYQILHDGVEKANGVAEECFAHWNAGDVVKQRLKEDNLI